MHNYYVNYNQFVIQISTPQTSSQQSKTRAQINLKPSKYIRLLF
jgi:hypothetical protein